VKIFPSVDTNDYHLHCNAIRSFATISSSKSSLLLKELESRYDKMNSIDGKWNELSKRIME
jgi:hypothetical protein